jgi:hypothetical protein
VDEEPEKAAVRLVGGRGVRLAEASGQDGRHDGRPLDDDGPLEQCYELKKNIFAEKWIFKKLSIFFRKSEASFLNGFLRLRGKLAPTHRWHSAELGPTRELAPMLVLKNWPQGS